MLSCPHPYTTQMATSHQRWGHKEASITGFSGVCKTQKRNERRSSELSEGPGMLIHPLKPGQRRNSRQPDVENQFPAGLYGDSG